MFLAHKEVLEILFSADVAVLVVLVKGGLTHILVDVVESHGLEGALHLAGRESLPVEAVEPLVLLQFVYAFLA